MDEIKDKKEKNSLALNLFIVALTLIGIGVLGIDLYFIINAFINKGALGGMMSIFVSFIFWGVIIGFVSLFAYDC